MLHSILNSECNLSRDIYKLLDIGKTLPYPSPLEPADETARYLYVTKHAFAVQTASLINNGTLPLAVPQGEIKPIQQINDERNTDHILLGEVLSGDGGLIEMAKLASDKENAKKIKTAIKRRSLISTISAPPIPKASSCQPGSS